MTTLKKILLCLLILSSCGEESSVATSSSDTTSTGTNPTSVTETSDPYIGVPAGSTPPVNTGVTQYPDPDPVDTPTLPGKAYSKCGILYKELNSSEVIFQAPNRDFIAQDYSQEAMVFLHNIRFLPSLSSDAYQVCFDGYRKGSNVFVETITSSQATTNPSIPVTGHTFRKCGYAAYQQSMSGDTYLTLQEDQVNIIIETNSTFASIPHVGRSAVTKDNGVEACFYSNTALYTDYKRHHKPFFPIDSAHFGAL